MTSSAVRLPVVEPDPWLSGYVLPVEDISQVVHQTGLPAQVRPAVDLKPGHLVVLR